MESIVNEYDRGTLAKRLSDLRGDRSQKEIAKNIDISDAALGTYENGTRVPSAEVIFKLAKYYNVSSDYLLGLRKEKSTNPKITDISDYTGLSDKAIENLSSSRNQPISLEQSKSYDYISELLSVSPYESISYSTASLEINLRKYCESEKLIQEMEPCLRKLQNKHINNQDKLMDYSRITNGNMIYYANKFYDYISKYGNNWNTLLEIVPEAIEMEKELDAFKKKITDIIPTLDPWDFCESINKTAKEYDDTRKALEEAKAIKARAFMEIIETINYLAQR